MEIIRQEILGLGLVQDSKQLGVKNLIMEGAPLLCKAYRDIRQGASCNIWTYASPQYTPTEKMTKGEAHFHSLLSASFVLYLRQ